MRPLPSDIREHGKTSVLQRVIIQLRENCGFVGAFRKHCDVHRDKEKVLYTYKRQAGCLKKQKGGTDKHKPGFSGRNTRSKSNFLVNIHLANP